MVNGFYDVFQLRALAVHSRTPFLVEDISIVFVSLVKLCDATALISGIVS